VTVGKRLFWGGKTLRQIEELGTADFSLPPRERTDEAAIIFTTGSTGPPKGVQYTHDIFHHQIDLIRSRYEIRPGGRDLACFPLFGLFDAMMGVTTIIPDMDPTKPADVDPAKVKQAIDQWEIDQAFGSPALWNTVSRWCESTGNQLPSLRKILSAGAPVPPAVLQRLRNSVHPDAEIYTPYGATESLPIASIESREILDETAAQSRLGRGTCVGTRFDSIDWKVIAIDDGPLATLADTKELPPGEIGELLVSGPVVTRQYVTRLDQNAIHKVADGERIWHRMGDVGYLDSQDRFWFCGRKTHRVITGQGIMFTVPCEAIFNNHSEVVKSALVGIGPQEKQTPVLIIEPTDRARNLNTEELRALKQEWKTLAADHELTSSIQDIRIYPTKLPVDIRHNSKIFREQLSVWAKENPC
jgi:acyl-CoA synthetase (AMP-forming)/AMP-acid ligase II